MRVHHLNCGTMAVPAMNLVAHCLLLELDDRLALIDAGYGLGDVAQPSRLGPGRYATFPVLDKAETAYEQIRALGLDPADVRDVVLTHADLDHAGGVPDFPDADIHMTSAEAYAWLHPGRQEALRYRPAHHAHGPRIVEHTADGEPWRGFAAAKPILGDSVVMISMPGHTSGHAAIAVEADDRTIVHAGDAFFDRRQIRGGFPHPGLVAFEALIGLNKRQVMANHGRLKELHRSGGESVKVINAHDAVMFREMAGS
ncbi:putative metallo-hydrolase [Nocardioides baekrokdamisoli]|uniref:Putative metallo-hydrolase n=1 Tax=Nocardioides baekrokdamisoli TaxID=1804624 RepID=A0A3G9IC02_9ACTN|nr:MBL fold metallo-hydrolase [Nocardioides baekrokdamisoli]BBH16417.1 putative metallo-hydrolase [Nocardioides baekrokdamisoli]